jgi:short-subunit dehydrogenase
LKSLHDLEIWISSSFFYQIFLFSVIYIVFMDNKYFNNKSAVITGAASGIGKELAMQLGQLGTNLVISDINMDRLGQVKEELEKMGVEIYGYHCNVTKRNEVNSLFEHVKTDFDDLHFLFSNAGLAVGGQFELFSRDQWKSIINVNISGCINIVGTFLPKMLEQGFGHVIVTSSIAGIIGVGGLIPYSTTKFANYGFCEALYGEFHSRGIDVSVICPFPLKTNLIENAQFSLDSGLMKDLPQEQLQDIINMGKQHFWDEFTKDSLNISEAVEIYLRKVAKKKFYICERRLPRLIYLIKGLWPNLAKRMVQKIGIENCELVNDSYQICYAAINKKLDSKT